MFPGARRRNFKLDLAISRIKGGYEHVMDYLFSGESKHSGFFMDILSFKEKSLID
jgi:hypothetical protein